MLLQQRHILPNDLRIDLYIISSGEIVLSPHPSMLPTYDWEPEGVTAVIDRQGIVLSESGSKMYEYEFNVAYQYKYEPLLKAWLAQQRLCWPK